MVQFPTQKEVETKTTQEILAKGTKKSQTEAEKTAKLAGIEEQIKLAQEQAATIQAGVSSLAEIDTTGAPSIDTNAGDVVATGNGLTAADTQMQELIKTFTKQSEDAAKRADAASKGLLASIAKRKDVKPIDTKQLTKDVLAEYGLTPESVQKVQGWMGQLTTYNQQIADLDAQKNAALGREEGRTGLEGVVRGRMAIIEKQYNSRISAKAAQAGVVSQQIQMERGLWTDARSTTSMIVNAATYDQQQELADLDWAMDTYKDLYDMASTEEQTAWNRAYTLAKDNLTQAQDDWNTKLGLNQRAAEAGVNLGWDSTYMESHTVEELNTEYSSRVAEQVRIEKAEEKVEVGLGALEFTDQEQRKLLAEGIDWKTPEGYAEALDFLYKGADVKADWALAEKNIQANVEAGNTASSQMAELYATTKRQTNLPDSDVKALMSQYGMVYQATTGIWIYYPPTGTIPEGEEKPWYLKSPAKWLWGKVTGK